MGDLRRDRSAGRGHRLAAIAGAVALVGSMVAGGVTGFVTPAGADTQGPLDFEAYSLGSVNGQDGWASTGPFDQAIVDNSTLPGAPVSFGAKSLRISDAVTSGSFGNQTFSKPTVDAAGEATADAGAFPTGTLQSRFRTSFEFASVTPGTEQVGMHTTVSPDRGDGARMSYVRIDDSPTGWNLIFIDYKDVAPHGTGGNLDDGCDTGDDFVETQIATGLSRTPHTLEIVMDFVPGGNNDIVKVYLDGTRIKTGTSWEDYFRYCTESGGGTGGPRADQSRITRNVLFRESGTAHPANAGGGLLIDDFTVSTSAGPTAVVVDDSDVVPNGSWRLESPASSTGTYAFDDGPAATPGGVGSLDLGIASGEHEWMNLYAYGACAGDPTCGSTSAATMTPLADFHALDYSTYRESGTTMPSFNIETYVTGVGGYATFAFVPNNALVANDTWQHWNTMDPTDGVWYSSRNVGSGVFNCAPFSCSASWDQIIASYPNAKVVLGLGPNVGTGGTFTGSIDNFTVGLSSSTTIYDFERLECTTTCYADPINGDDASSGLVGDPLQTIQAGVNKVQSGGTVELTSGTFTEDVVVTKAVDIHGQGPSTIVHPGTSTPNCGSGSLCAGATNVFLVQASDVEISDLTIDGDNPSLTGESVGGADVDARNGIITNHALGTFNGLSVHDTTIENIFLRGIYASSGGSFTIADNTVDNVQGDPQSIGIFNFEGGGVISGNAVSNANDAIASNWSEGTQFTNNTVTTSGSGVHTDNAGANGGTADVISGNVVSACTAGGYGVWAFVPYLAPTFSGNTISGCDVGMASFASCTLGGVNVCPGGVVPRVRFTNNDVTGTPGGVGVYVSTKSFGYGDGMARVLIDHNYINGADEGVVVEETGAAISEIKVTNNDLSGNSLTSLHNYGVTVVDARCNWWGQSSGPVPGQSVGTALRGPWLIASGLDSNCLAIMKVGTTTQTVVEGTGGTSQAEVTVTLDRGRWSATTVEWETVDGAATSASGDYTAASGTLTFAPGQRTKTILIDIGTDGDLEAHETFTVNFHDPVGALLPNTTKRVQILNDELPTLSVANVTATEGSPATFTVRISHRYFQAVTVNVSSASLSAVAPGDYVAVPGGTTVVIPAGGTSSPITVNTNLDSLNELAELFRLTFSSASVNNGPVNATATISANST